MYYHAVKTFVLLLLLLLLLQYYSKWAPLCPPPTEGVVFSSLSFCQSVLQQASLTLWTEPGVQGATYPNEATVMVG